METMSNYGREYSEPVDELFAFLTHFKQAFRERNYEKRLLIALFLSVALSPFIILLLSLCHTTPIAAIPSSNQNHKFYSKSQQAPHILFNDITFIPSQTHDYQYHVKNNPSCNFYLSIEEARKDYKRLTPFSNGTKVRLLYHSLIPQCIADITDISPCQKLRFLYPCANGFFFARIALFLN